MSLRTPEAVPEPLAPCLEECPACEPDRRPRVFICEYHAGWWDGYEEALARTLALAARARAARNTRRVRRIRQ